MPVWDSGVNITDAAIAAARRGWAVFPCRAGDKRPAIDRWEERATANVAHVSAAWRGRYRGFNVGIACGPSGLVGLDLDSAAHGEIPPDWRELGVTDGRGVLARLAAWAGQPAPETFMVRTPSGGWHLYFRTPAGSTVRNSAGAIGPLVDVRGCGGYLVGPGSTVSGGEYQVIRGGQAEPLPAWLGRLLTPDTARQASTAGPAGLPLAAAEARLRGLIEHVAAGGPGDRNGRLYWAACRGAELVAAGHVDTGTLTQQLAAAALAAGLRGGQREAERTIASGLRTGGSR